MTAYFLFICIMGLFILFFGHKLFWLFLGILGFTLGIDASLIIFGPTTNITSLGLALLFGLLGAVSTIFLQRFAILIGGFFGGGYLVFHLALLFGLQEPAGLVFFLIGGILGAFLFSFVFDWALIIFSSLIGAVMIAQIPVIGQSVRNAVFVICAVLGFIIQSKIFMYDDSKGAKKA